MRKILSERNLAALLFVLVIAAFAFAHEDSKKRNLKYSSTNNSISPAGQNSTFINNQLLPGSADQAERK